MVRTQIQLTEEQVMALKTLAEIKKLSVAELIRQSVDRLIASAALVSDDEKRRRAMAAAGRFRSEVGDISINHDKYLAEDDPA